MINGVFKKRLWPDSFLLGGSGGRTGLRIADGQRRGMQDPELRPIVIFYDVFYGLCYYELTKRAPRACQLDKGAAPPYKPLAAGLQPTFGALQACYCYLAISSEGNIA